ncbi:MAG: dihydroxy-acid dehydratase, partial [Gammaproteobacteria bacterium]
MSGAVLNPRVAEVTARIVARSEASRGDYLERMRGARGAGPQRARLACANLAHGFAAADAPDKPQLKTGGWPNIAIVSAYNDMLSAHRPLERYPAILKQAAREAGAVAQFAGGVPAMCDGVTQGRAGMELSLFSRDVIAMATAVALSHDMFDAALCLGVCDKIVPGLFIGALSFGHLPVAFVPAGPMPSGLPNKEKARIRQLFAQGKVGRDALLESESQSYHTEGTCTFYGTANSNQMLMEVMGLHLAGSAFVPPNTPLRDALTAAAARRIAALTALGDDYVPMAEIIDERAIVNAIVGLLATGGSTNHTIHLVAMARAAGVLINWDDMSELSEVTPLLTRVYP